MPPQAINMSEIPGVFCKGFELCELKQGETVVLISDQNTIPEYIGGAFAAARILGAQIYNITVCQPHDTYRINAEAPHQFGGKGMLDAIAMADLVITFFPANLTDWNKQIRAKGESGPRMLFIGESPQMFARKLSPPGLKDAVLHAAARWSKAKELRVVSDAGTDLTWTRGEDTPRAFYGFAEKPGRYDMWGGGHVSNFPDEGTANGKVVLKKGDLWVLPYVRVIEEDVHMVVRDGFIREVSGGVDALALTRWLDRCKVSEDDMDPYAVSHMGVGFQPNAHWDDALIYGNNMEEVGMSARTFAGCFLFSTGPSHKRKTKGHVDAPMNDCSVLLDNELVLDRGKFADPKMVVQPTMD